MSRKVDFHGNNFKDGMMQYHDGGSAEPTAPENDGQAGLRLMINHMMAPFAEAFARAIRNNTEAFERMGIHLKAQNDRMEALEKQIRLNTPVTPTQVRYMGEAIRKQARQLLEARSVTDDSKAVKSLSGMIRKGVLTRYGVGSLSEIPRHEYPVVLTQVQTWNDALQVRDVVKEARNRAEAT